MQHDELAVRANEELEIDGACGADLVADELVVDALERAREPSFGLGQQRALRGTRAAPACEAGFGDEERTATLDSAMRGIETVAILER